MYDTTNMILKKEQINDISFLKETPQFLTKITSNGNSIYKGVYYNGFLKNLQVSITKEKVRISNSSLSKFHFGNNIESLTISKTKHTVEEICDLLHLPFHKADVTRVDVAKNISLDYPPNTYLPYLGQSQYYNRFEHNNGLYYSNDIRQYVFYDKLKEQKIKLEKIPDSYQNKNLLRIELRLKKRIKNQIKVPILQAKDLYNTDIYQKLKNRWKQEYLNIEKIKTFTNMIQPTGSKKDLFNQLSLISILSVGQPKILEMINEWQTKSHITKKQAHDLRKSIRQLSQIGLHEKDKYLIDELTNKLNEIE